MSSVCLSTMMRVALCCAVVLLTSQSAWSQDFRASLVGRVLDPSGTGIPQTVLTATNIETGVSTRTESTDTGNYVLPSLAPGRYRLQAEHTGFKLFVREPLTLQIDDRVAVDVRMQVGDVRSTVTVTADASQLETASSSRGGVITGDTLVDLPLNGRNVFSLASLAPGVNFTARGQNFGLVTTTSNSAITSASISGGQPRANENLLDGIPNTGADGTVAFIPSVDATAEFKVQTMSFDAEFGRFTGGVINSRIKSGTNSLHGSLFEFNRNSAWNARDPFATSIPQFGYNLFGGAVGGPVLLPKLYDGRNRTFFFVNYEGERYAQPRANVSTVPSDLQRAGDFSRTFVRAGAATSPVTIYDPRTTRLVNGAYVRDVFPGNRIPVPRLDPVALNLLRLYPAPNAPGDSATGANNYLLSFKDPVSADGYVVRIDHRFTDRSQMFARFSWRHFRVERAGAFKGIATGDGEDRCVPGGVVDETYTINPTTVLNVRYGFTRYRSVQAAYSLGYDAASLGFPAATVAAFPVKAIPRIDISALTGLSAPGKSSVTAEDTHTLRGSLLKVFGNHSLKAGAETRAVRFNSGAAGDNGAGSFSFDTTFTRGPNPQVVNPTAGYGLASFLLGLGSSGSVGNNAYTAEQTPYYAFFAQDDYRVNSRLTLNLGLRYDWEGLHNERYNRQNSGFAFGVESPYAQAAKAAYASNPIAQLPASQFNVTGGLLFAGVNGQSIGLTDRDLNNIAPRAGFAFQVTPKTVLRGGYGIFYGATTYFGTARQGFSVSTPFVGTLNGGLTPVNVLSNPFPNGILAPPGSSQGLATLAGQSISFVPRDRQVPYAHQYQFSVQQQLPSQILLDVAYVGTAGRDLPVDQPINGIPELFRQSARDTFVATGRNILNDLVANPFFGAITSGSLNGTTTTRGQLLRPYPQFTGITAVGASIGRSRYDALQIQVTKRMSNGLSVIASYSKAKQLDQIRFRNDQDTQSVKELSANDIPQRFVVSAIYELPFGRGRKFFGTTRGLVGKLLEGYQLNVIYTAQGGIPIDISGAESTGVSAKLDSGQTVRNWFDKDAFRARQTLELINTARLPDVRTAGKNNVDISLFKTTSITERVRLQFRAKAFNAANRAEYSAPNTTFTDPNFGVVTGTNTFARQLQFALKLLF